jgi:hypothetical protein
MMKLLLLLLLLPTTTTEAATVNLKKSHYGTYSRSTT